MATNRYNLKTPFFALAPMANITTYPFASQAVQFGADLVWTPMVHTDTIINNWPEAEKTLNFREIKKYLVQIVGSEPEMFAKSVQIIEKNLSPLGVDLNFACPDKNIVKSGCGGALMQDQDKMLAIIAAIQKVTKLPISVKTRSGWDNPTQIFELAKAFQTAGVVLLTVHPRTVAQKFTGEADWEVIKKIRELVPGLLLVGSGDIKTWQDAIIRQKETGCDGIMIGRGSLGKPWIFEEIRQKKDHLTNLTEIKDLVLDLTQKADDIWGQKGIIESRTHYAYYFKDFPEAKEYRVKLMAANTLSDIGAIIN